MQSTIRMEIKKQYIQLTYKDHSSAKNLENSERENSYLLGTSQPSFLFTYLPFSNRAKSSNPMMLQASDPEFYNRRNPFLPLHLRMQIKVSK